MNDLVLRLENVGRVYVQAGAAPLEVLRNVDLAIQAGEMIALVGPSGAGKSTLLHLAGLLEKPDQGEVWINGLSCDKLTDKGLTQIRRETIGFVYQFHQLMPEFSALENVILPQLIAGVSKSVAKARAKELLEAVGLGRRLDHRPARLSGGEQQRVAIARAVANRPKLLLADEPTGNLDPETAAEVFATLRLQVKATGLAALIATHNLELAKSMDRTVILQSRTLVEWSMPPKRSRAG